MIPLKLSIEGLYSYRERQTIDFTKLTSNHLFGIFGEVGSGKSAILEAMMFALYGKSDRLSQNENRLYNMLNLQSERMVLELECLAGKSGEEKYKFVYEAKRNGKRFEDVKRSRRIISKEENGNWLPLETATPEEIIGMSSENFRQTVIIPQGKFREFIELGAKARADMMQELFHLDRFDLSDKVKALWGENKEQLTVTNTRLEQFSDLSKEVLNEQKESLEALLVGQKSLDVQIKKLQADLASQEELKKLFAEKTALQQKEALLLSKKSGFDELENRLGSYQEAVLHFKSLLDSLRHSEQEMDKKDTQLMSLASERSGVQHQLETKKVALEKATEAYENREKIAKQCEDLETLILLKQKKEALAQVEQKLEGFAQNLSVGKQQLEELKARQSEQQEELKTLKTKEVDVSMLKDVAYWMEKKDNLSKEKITLENKLNENREKQNLLFTNAIISLGNEGIELGEQNDLAGIESFLANQLAEIEEEKTVLEPRLHSLRVQNEFAHHSGNLEDGKPCPLCGSENHPSPLQAAQVKEELDEIELQLKKLGDEQLKLKKSAEQIAKAKSSFEAEEKLRLHQEGLLAEKQQEEKAHLASFVWAGQEEKSQADISLELKVQEETKAKIKSLEGDLESFTERLEKLRFETEGLEKQQQQVALEKASLTSEHEAYRKKMHFDEFFKFIDKSVEELNASIQKGKQKYEETERVFKQLDEENHNLEQSLTALDSKLAVERENHSQLTARKNEVNTEIEAKYSETGFTNLLEVKNTLSLQLDVEGERKKIAAFREELREVSSQIGSIQSKIGERVYDVDTHTVAEQILKETELKQQEISRQIGKLETEIKRITEGLEEQKKLTQTLKTLEIRQENLNTLSGLFKGKGFVKYISSIYLQNLVKAANVRFMKLTQNNLSLELNEQYEFIVRDQLNGGKTRLLKTLSGGQTFQASLCLALSLAENVKSLNESAQSFFFLDEGFGTLDKKSLSVVFETLRSLQRENRIVGIISHVEDLQQEIQVSLNITNDKEKGSLIDYSWEG